MQECRYCNREIKEGDLFCKHCGYDPVTDTMSREFVASGKPMEPPKKKGPNIFGGGVSSGVKSFACIGLTLLVFSIFYKNHFSIDNVIAEAKYFFMRLSKGKITIGGPKRSEKIEWIDMRTFEPDEGETK